jgi:hypothetical protein
MISNALNLSGKLTPSQMLRFTGTQERIQQYTQYTSEVKDEFHRNRAARINALLDTPAIGVITHRDLLKFLRQDQESRERWEQGNEEKFKQDQTDYNKLSWRKRLFTPEPQRTTERFPLSLYLTLAVRIPMTTETYRASLAAINRLKEENLILVFQAPQKRYDARTDHLLGLREEDKILRQLEDQANAAKVTVLDAAQPFLDEAS